MVDLLLLLVLLLLCLFAFFRPFAGLLISFFSMPLEAVGRISSDFSGLTFAKIFISVTFIGWSFKKFIRRDNFSFESRFYLILAFIFVALLPLLFTDFSFDSIYYTVVLFTQILIIFMIYDLVKDRTSFFYCVMSILFSSIYVSAIGLYEIYSGVSMFGTVETLYYASVDLNRFRITSTFYDPNALARYLVFCISLSLCLLVSLENLKHKFFILLLILLQFLCLFNTYSRTGMICTIFVFSTWALLNDKYGHRKIFSISSLVLTLVLIINPLSMLDPLFIRFDSISSNLFTAGSRLLIYQQGIDLFFKNPILGVGINNVAVAFRDMFGNYIAPHSLYLEVLLSTGLLGFMIFMIFVISTIRYSSIYYFNDIRKVNIFILPILSVLFFGLFLHGLKANEMWIGFGLVSVSANIFSNEGFLFK